MATQRRDWYRLDNAATIYPAATRLFNTHVFRIAVTLLEAVDADVLTRALEQTLPRFPSFAVTLHRGAFWNYLAANALPPKVLPETKPPCGMMLPKENNGYCFRVLYFDNRISLETYHVLADGAGAMAFLRSLLYNYLRQRGYDVSYDETILTSSVPVAAQELEDAFQRYADPGRTELHQESEAFHIGGLLTPEGDVRVIHVELSVAQLKAKADEHDVTLTEYLVALFAYGITESYRPEASGLPVRIQVPVNLRRFFSTKTLRNFSAYVCVEIPPDANFEGCLAAVREQIRRDATAPVLRGRFSANVHMQRKPVLRIAPLFAKRLVLRNAFHRYGEKQMTATLSNLGIIALPASIARYVSHFDMLLPCSAWLPINAAVCSYGDALRISFTRAMEETEVERFFCRFLAQRGLTLTVSENGRDAQ